MVKMLQKISLQKEFSGVDMGVLIGLLLTDGCVTWNGDGQWIISFANKSEELLTIFKDKIRKLFGITKFSEWVDEDDIKSVTIRNKKIFSILTSIVPSFRTQPFENGEFPPSKLPNFFFTLSKPELSEILKVMFSADGCVSLGVWWNDKEKSWKLKKRVQLSSWHPTIKKQVFQILKEKFSIQSKVRWNGVVIENKDDIVKFRQWIGFVNGVKISGKSKNWKGFEKNQVLDLVIESMKFKKKDLEQFKSKEEVLDFLRKRLEVS